MENIENTIKQAEEKLVEIRSAKKQLEQERALAAAPVNSDKENHSKQIREIQNAVKENRNITLADTAKTTESFIHDFIEDLKKDTGLLGLFRYFRGKYDHTEIPVFGGLSADPEIVKEGGTFKQVGATATTATITPRKFAFSIPLTYEALNFSETDFEAELIKAIKDSYERTLVKAIIEGISDDDYGVVFDSLYSDKSKAIEVEKMNPAALAKLAVEMKGYNKNAVIFMPNSHYTQILENAGNTASDKAWVAQIVNGEIEGVKIVLSPYASTDVIALGGSFDNYCVGISDDLQLITKQNVVPGTDLTYIDCTMFMGGKLPKADNLFALKLKA